MKYWEDFLSEVMPYVENCPLPIAKNHVMNAAIEFCQKTALWRYELAAINIDADIADYELHTELDSDETISAIDYATLVEASGETPLYVATKDELSGFDRGWRTKTGNTPSAVMLTDTDNMRVYPIPETSVTNGLIVGLILKPSRVATGLPDWIHEQWAEGIAHGAKARLFSMKTRSWYDPAEAEDERSEFNMAVNDATIRTNKGHARRSLSVKMRPIA